MNASLDYSMVLQLYTAEFLLIVTHLLERVKVQGLMMDLILLNLCP